jgi:hypothetical protein
LIGRYEDPEDFKHVFTRGLAKRMVEHLKASPSRSFPSAPLDPLPATLEGHASAVTFFAMRSGKTVDGWLKDAVFQALSMEKNSADNTTFS